MIFISSGLKKTSGKVNITIMVMLTALLMISLLLTGCGNDDYDSIEEAYEHIEDLEYEEALALFEEAKDDDGDLRYIYRGEGIAYIGLSRYDEAIDALLKALSLSTGVVNGMDFDLNFYLATAYAKSGRTDEAIEVYDSILALRPNDKDAIYLRGVLYARKEMLTEAMDSFNRVIELDSDNYDRIIQIYTILQDNGYKETGQEYLMHALENETKKMSNYEKGQISFYLEDYESAKTYLEKARDEEGYEAILLLGKTYERLGDNNYAVSVYSSYINGGDVHPEILNEMGLCKLAMNDYQGALQAFQEAINIKDNNMLQTLKFNEIVCYEYLGDFNTAYMLMEKYVKNYPDDENAKREYAFLKSRHTVEEE